MAKKKIPTNVVARGDEIVQPYRFGDLMVPEVSVWPDAGMKPFLDGPWQREADKYAWWDGATGLPCIIRREDKGNLGGYVGLPPSHPLYGFRARSIPSELDLEVHGGIEYAEECRSWEPESRSICHVPARQLDEVHGSRFGIKGDVWWLGFQCDKSYDHIPKSNRYQPLGHGGAPAYRDEAYVYRQTVQLAAQLHAISAGLPKPVLADPPPPRVLDVEARRTEQ